MARNEWSRWGRGSCEGYGLEVGFAIVRFTATVVRSQRDEAGLQDWSVAINGRDGKRHATREDAMAHVEHELACEGARFVAEFEAYKARRAANRFSRAVDAARAAAKADGDA